MVENELSSEKTQIRNRRHPLTRVQSAVNSNNPHRVRNLIIILIVVVALVLLAVGIYSATRPKQQLSKNPIISQYQRQLPTLAAAAQKNPNDAKARQEYAVALYATGDKAKAKDQYEAQTKLSPKDATMYNNLGNVYRDLQNYEKAISSYQQSIELNKQQTNAYVNLSNLYLYTLDKKDLAIATLEDGVRNSPENQDLAVLLGIAYERAGDKDKARETFQAVLDKNSQNIAAAAGLKRVQ